MILLDCHSPVSGNVCTCFFICPVFVIQSFVIYSLPTAVIEGVECSSAGLSRRQARKLSKDYSGGRRMRRRQRYNSCAWALLSYHLHFCNFYWCYFDSFAGVAFFFRRWMAKEASVVISTVLPDRIPTACLTVKRLSWPQTCLDYCVYLLLLFDLTQKYVTPTPIFKRQNSGEKSRFFYFAMYNKMF